MTQTTEAYSGQKNCIAPAGIARRFFAVCVAFTLSAAPAFAQAAGKKTDIFEKVDAAAGWGVGKWGGVFLYPSWTFEQVGDQVKDVTM